MNQERLYQVLLGPYTTEKTEKLADKLGQLTLKVLKNATKVEVKTAVEKLFKVSVESVNIVYQKNKKKRFKNKEITKKGFKKAVVSLAKGHDINWDEFVNEKG